MNNEKYENKTMNEKEEIINKDIINSVNENLKKNDENKKSILNPTSFEIVQKVDLCFLLDTNIINIKGNLITIHELSNENIGFLLSEKLIIISHKTFKTIKIIKPNSTELRSKYNCIRNEFVDFIELKNCNIVLWTSSIILIYNKEYNLIQRIDEREHGNM